MRTATITALVLFSCAPRRPAPASMNPPPPPETLNAEAITGVSAPELQRLLHEHWEHTMARSPVWATQLGDHRYDDQLGDPSTPAIARHYDTIGNLLGRSASLDRSALSPEDALTLEVFQHSLRNELAREPCAFELWSVSPARNAVAENAHVITEHPVQAVTDLDDLYSRIAQMPAAVEAEMERLEDGRARGLTPGAEAVQRTLAFIDQTLSSPDDTSPLYAAARDPIEGIAEDQRLTLAARHAEQVRSVLIPSFQAYRRYLHDTLLPAARPPQAATLAGLPQIPSCYARLITKHTTLTLSPEEIHAVGLSQISAVHAEFMELAERLYGTTRPELAEDRQALFAHLRGAPEFRFDSPEAILRTAEESLRAAEAAVASVFHQLPETPCEVAAIPANIAPFTYVGWYEPPTTEKNGIYRVNTHAPQSRLRHEARALAFHESVPGHHLQLALTQELPETPAFRRNARVTAYVEGWALYAERLADELSLYPSDVDRLGMLSYDAWRSARLVVDTGLHHFGWTRSQAETWMRENTPLAENNISNEVDRYIAWPGQALGYKLGQLELLRLRSEAKEKLGDRFVLADFHAVVLENGPVPLPVLAAQVERWIETGGGPPSRQ